MLIIALLLLWIGLLATRIYYFSLLSDSAPADVAIVLGASVHGEQPSPVFRERIEHAITLYKTQQIKQIIFTGGVGEQSSLAESVVASRYALTRGVAATDMACEIDSKITWENLRGAKQWLTANQRVLIVSDPLHLRRALTMARDLELDAYPSPTPSTRYTSLQSQIPFLMREVYFYSGYLLTRLFISSPDSEKTTRQSCS